MATTTVPEFRRALDHTLVLEGGKVDHPKDPGGRTNKGVTQRVYNGWRTKNTLPVRDVYEIADNEVEAIYRFQFWEPIQGALLPPGVGLVVFDGAVNSGTKQSVKWLQRALGFTPDQVDGVLGAVTLGAIKAHTDHDRLITAIIDRREIFLRNLKTWNTFGKGWLRRIYSVEATGQAWAMGTVGPNVEYIPNGDQKANIEDAKSAPSRVPGDIGMAGGTTTSITTQAIDQLTPFDSFGFVRNIIVGITIAGIVVAGLAAAYRWWATRKAAKLADALDTAV